jgi:hypothetical protein
MKPVSEFWFDFFCHGLLALHMEALMLQLEIRGGASM